MASSAQGPQHEYGQRGPLVSHARAPAACVRVPVPAPRCAGARLGGSPWPMGACLHDRSIAPQQTCPATRAAATRRYPGPAACDCARRPTARGEGGAAAMPCAGPAGSPTAPHAAALARSAAQTHAPPCCLPLNPLLPPAPRRRRAANSAGRRLPRTSTWRSAPRSSKRCSRSSSQTPARSSYRSRPAGDRMRAGRHLPPAAAPIHGRGRRWAMGAAGRVATRPSPAHVRGSCHRQGAPHDCRPYHSSKPAAGAPAPAAPPRPWGPSALRQRVAAPELEPEAPTARGRPLAQAPATMLGPMRAPVFALPSRSASKPCLCPSGDKTRSHAILPPQRAVHGMNGSRARKRCENGSDGVWPPALGAAMHGHECSLAASVARAAVPELIALGTPRRMARACGCSARRPALTFTRVRGLRPDLVPDLKIVLRERLQFVGIDMPT